MPATTQRTPVRYPRAITRFVDGSIQVHSPNGDFVCLDLYQQVGPLVCLRRLHPSVTQVWLTREQLQAVADVWATLCADVPDQRVADHVPGDEEPWEGQPEGDGFFGCPRLGEPVDDGLEYEGNVDAF